MTLALHTIANWMSGYQGDLFVDFPKLYEIWQSGNKAVLGVRKTGSNIIGVDVHSVEDLQRTLGVDFVVTFWNEKVYMQNISLSEKEFDGIKAELRRFGYEI